jgi:hypothetical protein
MTRSLEMSSSNSLPRAVGHAMLKRAYLSTSSVLVSHMLSCVNLGSRFGLLPHTMFASYMHQANLGMYGEGGTADGKWQTTVDGGRIGS